MDNCIGIESEQLSNARLALESAYLGDAYPVDAEREKDGWSTYVDRTVLETVEWAKGPLLKVFAGTEDIVRYEPTGPDDEQYAEDASDYVNKQIFSRCGFDLVYGPLSDALYKRIGWARVYYDSQDRRTVARELSDLSPDEAMAVAMLAMEYEGQADVDFSQAKDTGLYDATVYWLSRDEQIKVEPLPSDRVIFSKDATTLENARFVAHWEDRLFGDLLKEGYSREFLKELPSDWEDYPETKRQRLVNADDSDTGQENVTDGTKLIRVYQAYMTADIKDNGELGRYRVTFAGSSTKCKVMDVEEWTMYRPPLFNFSSLPLPYSPAGLCLADLVMDLQALRTELTRDALDGLALSNQGELVINRANNTAQVNLDQLLARGPGRVYETEGDATITPLPVSGATAVALTALEATDKTKEQRTGIGMGMQGLSADVLQDTATGAAILEEQQNIRLEMIARVFAESYKDMAKYILMLANRYMRQPIRVQRRGQFADLTPSLWNPGMSVVATVGLGTGNRKKKAESVQQILALQAQFITAFGKNSPVRMENVVRAAHKLAETLGFESPEQFFGSLEDAQRAEQAIMANQGQDNPMVQIKQQELQLKAQAEQQKIQLQREKAAADVQNDAAKIRAAMELRAAELQQKGLLAQRQIELEAELDAIKLATTLPDVGATEIREPTQL
jgi:hypothetical protein